MSLIVAAMVSGIIATALMTTFLFLPAWLGWHRVDVVRAVGALVSHDREHALTPGLVIHFAMGAAFACLYAFALQFMGWPLGPLSGAFLGLVHGVLVMLFVAIIIMEHHPMDRYRERGLETGLAQIAGHVIYGLTVGTFLQILH